MEAMFKRVFMFVVGVVLGYCTGFNDATTNTHMIHKRVIQRVQNFGENTVGERQRETERMIEGIEP